MEKDNRFVLYGATGYTAGLVIEMAATYGLVPILAGRNKQKLETLAQQFGLTYRVASLDDPAALDALLQDETVVLHCAGPFSSTALPMQQACLRTGTHYLDLTGEVSVFEKGALLHQEAIQKRVLLLSGVGFDVVPTDCLALHLQQRLPDATHLQLAFSTEGGSVSHGTALTAVENLGAGGLVRQKGQLKAVPSAYKTIRVPFKPAKSSFAMTVPWGDLATAYRTTGIPNIETFMAVSPGMIRLARLSNRFNWLLRKSVIRNLVGRWVDRRVTGADASTRKLARSFVWGRVWNEKGESREARLQCPDAYTLTAITALLSTKKVLNRQGKPGFQTPAGLFGADLILEVAGVLREDLS